jgi:Toprim domain
MTRQASDLARRLAAQAETVCRHYLSNGRRAGRYWIVGDVRNTPGRSMFVRLEGPTSGKGAAGRWTDAATSQHGDLLDLIALNIGLTQLRDVLDEARAFLSLPRPIPPPARCPAPTGSPESARRLFAMSQPIAGSIAEMYLCSRGITGLRGAPALRFHPRCYYRPDADAPTETWPALIAAVTDPAGNITGAHRTWLDPNGHDKAPVDTPRRAMGHLLGHGVRFGEATNVMAAGEGIETMLSLRSALPQLPMVAALSANHLAALIFRMTLERLYVVRDNDAAGAMATATLAERARAAGIEAVTLSPTMGDFNEDLDHLGIDHVRATLRLQLAPDDASRFLGSSENL